MIRAMENLNFQIDVAARMLVASFLGASIGLEREVHGHPAGMRTHLLVSLGSALFTVLSIFGFPPGTGAPLDPSRVAAQVVSGIGFLGAGAIIKDGFSVRGLTTAASLWATAAVGMAAGAGQEIIALVAAAIILFSLWPLNRIATRVHGISKERRQLTLTVLNLGVIAEVTSHLTDHAVEIVAVETEPAATGYRVELGVRTGPRSALEAALDRIRSVDGVGDVTSTGPGGD